MGARRGEGSTYLLGTTSNIGVSIISLHDHDDVIHDTPRLHTLKRIIRNLMRLAHI